MCLWLSLSLFSHVRSVLSIFSCFWSNDVPSFTQMMYLLLSNDVPGWLQSLQTHRLTYLVLVKRRTWMTVPGHRKPVQVHRLTYLVGPKEPNGPGQAHGLAFSVSKTARGKCFCLDILILYSSLVCSRNCCLRAPLSEEYNQRSTKDRST